MPKKKLTWREKLGSTAQKQNLPRVVEVGHQMSKSWGEGTMVIPSPLEVDALMKTVPKGKLMTVNQVRAYMAKKYKSNFGCPITTGIFVTMVARAAEEDKAEGNRNITPYWRTIKIKGALSEKYPGGRNAHAAYLKDEGHEIEKDKAGNPKRVKDWEDKLVEI